jgi:type VI secretion system VasD/TssJ family lipoprotein
VWQAVRLPFLRHPPRALALLVLAPLLAGCAKVPLVGKGGLKVQMTATADCNSCGKGTGYPLTYRVLQVTDASLLTGMSLTQLWDKEEKLLGPALLERSESFIDPGQTKTLSFERAEGAAAVVVVANFCRSAGPCWYYAQPFSRGGTVKVVAGPECLTEAR